MNPREQFDLGPCYLPYRLPKNISRNEKMTKVVTGRLKVNLIHDHRKLYKCFNVFKRIYPSSA